MKTLYFECNMGAAGDMMTAALLELHPDPDSVIRRLNALGIPGAEIRRQRLALARRLLRETARPVAEIARDAGFSSAAYFCTAFQAETGATPFLASGYTPQ